MNDSDIKTKVSKLKKVSLSSRLLFNFLTLVCLVVFVFGAIWVYDTTNILDKDIKANEYMQKSYAKTELKSRVESVKDYIQYRKEQTEKQLENELQSRTDEAYAIMMSIYEENKETKSKDEITLMIVNALKDIRFNNGRGYYFIDTLNGDVILYPVNAQSQGTNLINLQDDYGNYALRDEIDLVKAQGQGFVEGYWKSPGKKDYKTYKKITFVKSFEPYGWYLGCGDYVDDFTREIQNELLEYVNSLRYGQDESQYIFIHDYNGMELANGLYPEYIGNNNYNLTDANGVHVVQEQIYMCKKKGGGFLTHYWENVDGDGEYEKLTYVESYPEWQWVIGTGISMEYINKMVDEQQQLLVDNVKQKILYIIFLIGCLILVSVIVVNYFTATIRKNINVFTQVIKSSSEHLNEIDMNNIEYNDFDELISVTNSMKNRINNLLFRDALTGLYNRRFINNKLDEIVGRADDNNAIGVALIDIDYFKKINDTYGHQVGDAVLKQIASIMDNILSGGYRNNHFFLGRFGGEEFLVIFENISKEELIEIANHIVEEIASSEFEGIKEHVTISIGIAVAERISCDSLIKQADDMLYRAKQKGRNQVQY